MVRIVLMLLGYLCLLIGFVGVLTPIPFGLVFLILACLLLIPSHPGATRVLRALRLRFRRFDTLMSKAASNLPSPYRRILRRTDIDLVDRHLR